jgi:hypothetical protein
MRKVLLAGLLAVCASAANAGVEVQFYNPPASDPTYTGQNGGPIPYGAAWGGPVYSSDVAFGTNTGWEWWVFGYGNAFGAVVTGFLSVPTTGTYTIGTTSDDGSFLTLDGQTIGNGGQQPPTLTTGTWNLTAGTSYAFTIDYFNNNYGTAGLDLDYINANGATVLVPGTWLSTSTTPAPAAAIPFLLGLARRRRRK